MTELRSVKGLQQFHARVDADFADLELRAEVLEGGVRVRGVELPTEEFEALASPTGRTDLAFALLDGRPSFGDRSSLRRVYVRINDDPNHRDTRDPRMPLVMRDLRARATQWYADTLVRSLAQAGAAEFVLARPAGSMAPVEERVVAPNGRVVAREISPARGTQDAGLGATDLDAMFRRLVGHRDQRALSPAALEAMEKLEAWDRAAPDEKRLANLRRLTREGWSTGLGDILAEILTERLLPKETVRAAL